MNFKEKHNFFNELGFFTLSNAAPSLGKFFEDSITISSPMTELIQFKELGYKIKNSVYMTIRFNEGEIGETHVILTERDAMTLAKYAIEKRFNILNETEEWDEFNKNAVEEIINILGGNMTEILTVIFGREVEINVPELTYDNSLQNIYNPEANLVLNTINMYLGENQRILIKELASEDYYMNLVKTLKKRV